MKNQNGLFQIEYADNSKHVGNILNKEWSTSPKKPIRSLLFIFGNRTIKLENYWEYDLTMEVINIFGQKPRISNIMIVGRKENCSDCIKFDFTNGEINKYESAKRFEYGNLISNTWIKGINGLIPKCYHN
jgi:hypothetical protein